jgi:cytoskeletal protein CcmA (bactofilin family)
MKTDNLTNLKIIGDNKASGGNYNDAKIIGNGIINGNLDCSNLKCVGDSRIDGSVKANNTRIVGSVSVSGSLESEAIRVTGNINMDGNLAAKDIEIRGGMDIKGNVKSDHMRVIGYTTIKKNCEAETFVSEGPIMIGGMLNANDVVIKIHSKCRVGEIGGETIQVRKGHYSKLGEIIKTFFTPNDVFNTKLIVDSIEGDEIRLEDTKAKTVRGKNVLIGDGCEIETLEYSEECRIAGRSTVKAKRKVSA